MVISVTDTQPDMVLPPPLGVGVTPAPRWQPTPTVVARPRGQQIVPLVLAVVGIVSSLIVPLAAIVPTTFFVDKQRCTLLNAEGGCADEVTEAVKYGVVPAAAEPVNPRLEITGTPQYPSSADVNFVTVRQPEIRLLDWFVLRHNPAGQLLSNFEVNGDGTPQERRERALTDMSDAKKVASFVAMQKAGFEVSLDPGEVIIDGIVCLEATADSLDCAEYAPADALLDPDDKLLEVDGRTLVTINDLTDVLSTHKAGDVVEIVFERAGEEMSGEIELTSSPDDVMRTIVGFFPADTTVVTLPEGVGINIDTDQVGGPSAGAAFTVTLIDELTEGELLGGVSVAITGTMNIDGTVGAIGGLTSKASAVQQVGLKYFIVPTAQGEGNIADARRVVGDDVEIIPVADIDELLAALERLGGDPLVPVRQ